MVGMIVGMVGLVRLVSLCLCVRSTLYNRANQQNHGAHHLGSLMLSAVDVLRIATKYTICFRTLPQSDITDSRNLNVELTPSLRLTLTLRTRGERFRIPLRSIASTFWMHSLCLGHTFNF